MNDSFLAKQTTDYADWLEIEKQNLINSLTKGKIIRDHLNLYEKQYLEEVKVNYKKKNKRILKPETRFKSWLNKNGVSRKNAAILLKRYELLESMLKLQLKIERLYELPQFQFDLLLDAPREFLTVAVDILNNGDYEAFQPMNLIPLINQTLIAVNPEKELVQPLIDNHTITHDDGCLLIELINSIQSDPEIIARARFEVKELANLEVVSPKDVRKLRSVLKDLKTIDSLLFLLEPVYGVIDSSAFLAEADNESIAHIAKILKQVSNIQKHLEKVNHAHSLLGKSLDQIYINTTEALSNVRQFHRKIDEQFPKDKIQLSLGNIKFNLTMNIKEENNAK